MTRVHGFHGGILPPERKALSRPGELVFAGIPDSITLPLAQHLGTAAEAVVEPGDRVLGGQCIAEPTSPVSAAVHAPTSGRVIAVDRRPVPHASGLTDICISLATDGLDEWVDPAPRLDPDTTTAEQLIARIRESGIVGLGGAGFPTDIKLATGHAGSVHTVIINGAECEPYITADDTLMQRRPADIIEGAGIIARVVGATSICIGIEDNKPEAIRALTLAAADSRHRVEVVTVPTRYPSGGERQLIELLTGEQVPSGSHPAAIGLTVQNPGTAVAVLEAVRDGRPLTRRIVTVTGESLATPGNFDVLLGTPVAHLLALAGHSSDSNQRLIHGGPMMGFVLGDSRAPVVKITNCILAPAAGELPVPGPAQACIRCGLCAEACPASLLPQQLYWYARARDHEGLEAHNLFDCIECGACSWVCPSEIPLVQYYRAGKAAIREAEAEKARSDRARVRFEERQQRVAREAAEREARRAARKAAAQAKAADGAAEDPVQAAIARAKARKSAAGQDG